MLKSINIPFILTSIFFLTIVAVVIYNAITIGISLPYGLFDYSI